MSDASPTTTNDDAQLATLELRDAGYWAVVYRGTVVGRHTAKYRALAQAEELNR